jgi:hypothetical protein
MKVVIKTSDLEKDPNIILSIETARYLASLCTIDFDEKYIDIPKYFNEIERYHAIHYLRFKHIEKDFKQLK